jgi:hypothetical protein
MINKFEEAKSKNDYSAKQDNCHYWMQGSK